MFFFPFVIKVNKDRKKPYEELKKNFIYIYDRQQWAFDKRKYEWIILRNCRVMVLTINVSCCHKTEKNNSNKKKTILRDDVIQKNECI